MIIVWDVTGNRGILIILGGNSFPTVIIQVAGAGFGGPLINLKLLPCDQNKYL